MDKLESRFSTTLKSDITTTGTGNIYLNDVPTVTEGSLVIGVGTSSEEEIHYSGVGTDYVVCDDRGQGGTTATTHSTGDSVDCMMSAKALNDIVDKLTGASSGVILDTPDIDNGTIDSVAINGSPIGATTPSTGAFTDLTASGTVTLPSGIDIGDTEITSTTVSINKNGTGDRTSRFDFYADDVNAVSGRLWRTPGENGDWRMYNFGTGNYIWYKNVSGANTQLAVMDTDSNFNLKQSGAEYQVEGTPIIQRVFIGQGYRYPGEGDGDEVITGVGFQPKVVLFFQGRASDDSSSIGAGTSSTTDYCIYNDYTYSKAGFAGRLGYCYSEEIMDLKSLDSDGFTVTFSNMGSYNIEYFYICLG